MPRYSRPAPGYKNVTSPPFGSLNRYLLLLLAIETTTTMSSVNVAMHELRLQYATGRLSEDGVTKIIQDGSMPMVATLDQDQVRELELMSALSLLGSSELQSLKEKHPLYNFEPERCRELFLSKLRVAQISGNMTSPLDVYDTYPIGRFLSSIAAVVDF